MHLKQNTELQNGKYRIIHVLGQGGFGITYLAENVLLGNQVAIKEFFPKDYCGRNTTSHLTLGTESNRETVEKLKSRFLKEARNIAKLDHPGIVRVFDVFEENDTAYYVMEYIHGENLNEIVKQNGPLSEDRAIRYISEVGSSLEYIHSKNMTHFDVKPANIIIRKKDDLPILIDFGLSKQYDSKGDATSTMMQAVSHGYSPIELYNAGSLSEFSPQTDVYSLAATLYFLVVGKVPPSPSEIIDNGFNFPPTVNEQLKEAIEEGMQSGRSKRPQSVNTFIELIKDKDEDKAEESAPDFNSNLSSGQNEYEYSDETHIIDSEDYNSESSSQTNEETGEQSYTSEVEEGNYEYEDNEVELTKGQRILNWWTGTSHLHYNYLIPTGRKIFYAFAKIFLIFSACLFPILGWWFMIACYRSIIEALQRLCFQGYLHEWDDAYDYSRKKATTIVCLILLIPVAWTIFFIIIGSSSHKRDAKEYVSNLSLQCPFPIFDAQVSSVNFIDDEIVFNCVSADSLHSNRKLLNRANVEIFKPYLIDESIPENKIFNNTNVVFNFINNGEFNETIKLTSKEIADYKKLSPKERATEYLNAYMELQNAYFPWDLGENVKLTVVRIDTYPDGKDYLSYTFADDNRTLEREFGDSIDYKIYQFLPYNLPYLSESVVEATDGMGYNILTGINKEQKRVLKTSGEMKQLIEEYKRNNR